MILFLFLYIFVFLSQYVKKIFFSGAELLIKVVLPNDVVLLATDSMPINVSIVWHYLKDSKWFLECPDAQLQSTTSTNTNNLNDTDEPSRIQSSTTEALSEEYIKDYEEHSAVGSMEPTSNANRVNVPNVVRLLISSIGLISNLSVYFNFALSNIFGF